MSTVVEIEPVAEPLVEQRVEANPRATQELRTDTLADSVVTMLMLAGVQRLIGFARGILVCRWLTAEQLGEWDMVFGFLTIAAPLSVLGLPGSFGRYVEYFRQRGQLSRLLWRTGIACGVLTVLSVLAIAIARPQFSQIVFGRPDRTNLILCSAVVLLAVIWFNYLTELINALRMARFGTIVQFLSSLTFAALSVLFLGALNGGVGSLVVAYGLACVLQIGCMLWFLRSRWRPVPAAEPAELLQVEAAAGPTRFWSRLLPFAAWVWVTNLLYNLFEIVDRYMIVHHATGSDPLAMVGAYHSSRIVPLLMISIAGLLSGILLPHLSHDWEAGRRRAVSSRLNLALKLLALLLFAGSVAILLGAPLLFDVAFKGKFDAGKAVLPWTLTYCAWFGLASMAQTYLWCAERARMGCLALFAGLVTNVLLNLVLLPRYGLPGAVLATVVANAVGLVLMYLFSAMLGMRFERSTLALSAVPLTLGMGPWAAAAALVAVAGATVGTDALLSRADKQQIIAVWRSYRQRFGKSSTIAAT